MVRSSVWDDVALDVENVMEAILVVADDVMFMAEFDLFLDGDVDNNDFGIANPVIVVVFVVVVIL